MTTIATTKLLKQFGFPKWLKGGYSMIESNIAVAMMSIFISAMGVVNGNVLGMLKSMKENATATQALQERVEQMRIANWVQITDAGYVATKLLNTSTGSGGTLAQPIEVLTVTAYPDPASAGVLQVKRQGSTVQQVSSSSTLAKERTVQVNLTLTWSGVENRQHTRAVNTVIAKGGIAK